MPKGTSERCCQVNMPVVPAAVDHGAHASDAPVAVLALATPPLPAPICVTTIRAEHHGPPGHTLLTQHTSLAF